MGHDKRVSDAAQVQGWENGQPTPELLDDIATITRAAKQMLPDVSDLGELAGRVLIRWEAGTYDMTDDVMDEWRLSTGYGAMLDAFRALSGPILASANDQPEYNVPGWYVQWQRERRAALEREQGNEGGA